MRRATLGAAVLLASALGVPAGARADVSRVLGSIPCTPQDGVRFCEGTGAVPRVRSFDGVPLDVNVAKRDGYTLLGSPTVIADLEVAGVNAALAARLWDVGPGGRLQRLVARAIYRPEASGRQVFQLHPNGWRFARGHTPKLELIGADVPYSRAPNGRYSLEVSALELRLPVADRPGSSPGVHAPRPSVLSPGAKAVEGVSTVRLHRPR